ncbi:MAG: 2Fe-2S ferredoxin [SAR324 cluster bacterium]|uniref:2Fe-2S ferredoxin n=1 Tax=SAR324 cluster bacterium TaxID=2024889 RepID=A0A2A4SU74_9DELT|nr:MAG: 2Fe-2S ferredoxin [SAR324 cluster bacterium]
MPGSILDTISTSNADLIDHACGGVQACCTCHVVVEKGFDTCNEISDREDDYLDETPGLTLKSRLSCACVPDGSEDIVIRIPGWNRNEVKE